MLNSRIIENRIFEELPFPVYTGPLIKINFGSPFLYSNKLLGLSKAGVLVALPVLGKSTPGEY